MGILGSFVSWGTQDSFIHVGGRLFCGITLYYFVFFHTFPLGKKRLALFMVYLLFFWKPVSIIHGLFTNRRSTLAQSYERLRTVANGCTTSGKMKREPYATNSGKLGTDHWLRTKLTLQSWA